MGSARVPEAPAARTGSALRLFTRSLADRRTPMGCRAAAAAALLLGLLLAAALLLAPPAALKDRLRALPEVRLPGMPLVGEALLQARFSAWQKALGKTYASDAERALRMQNFAVTVAQIEAHNARTDVTWTMGLNAFSDWSDDEFMHFFNLGSLQGQQECSATAPKRPRSSSGLALASPPSRIDWREAGIVSPVKNQGHCGSCWTFSTTGALEAHWKKATGNWVSLSEQQLLDCAGNYDNHGCNGGLPSHAFEYILENGGIASEKAYPYLATSAEDRACKFRKWRAAAKVKGVVNITQFDENELVAAVGTVGPVSVAFQVASDFRSYAAGVYSSTVCQNQPKDVNHAVLAVGYDVDPATNMKYWIIKNSWGENWGLQGYFHMERGKNMCGVSDCASYPVVDA